MLPSRESDAGPIDWDTPVDDDEEDGEDDPGDDDEPDN